MSEKSSHSRYFLHARIVGSRKYPFGQGFPPPSVVAKRMSRDFSSFIQTVAVFYCMIYFLFWLIWCSIQKILTLSKIYIVMKILFEKKTALRLGIGNLRGPFPFLWILRLRWTFSSALRKAPSKTTWATHSYSQPIRKRYQLVTHRVL